MSDTSPPKKQWLEFGPLIVFFVVYFWLRRTMEDPSGAIYPAAGVLAVLSLASVTYSKIRHKTVPGVLVFSAIMVCLFAAAAYFLNDPRFFYVKPTIMYVLFGLGSIGGTLIGKNVIKILMTGAFDLPDKAWNVLAVRWGLFFFAMAALNEYVWRNYSEPTWVKFKIIGLTLLTFLFVFSQMPYMLKHGKVRDADGENSGD